MACSSTIHALYGWNPPCSQASHHQGLYFTMPVSRHKHMHLLMFLCHEVVHKHITQDNLDKLGLLKRLVELYVSENPLVDKQLFPLYEVEDMELDRASEGAWSGYQSTFNRKKKNSPSSVLMLVKVSVWTEIPIVCDIFAFLNFNPLNSEVIYSWQFINVEVVPVLTLSTAPSKWQAC